MNKKRDWIPNEWVWGYKPNTNIRVRGRVSNANDLADGYVYVFTDEGENVPQIIFVARDEDPRIK